MRERECVSDDGGGVVDIMLCYHIFDDVDNVERERDRENKIERKSSSSSEPSVYIFEREDFPLFSNIKCKVV